MKAFGRAGDLLLDGDPEAAMPYLEWAKATAPRSAVVREALGIARYASGDLPGAASELTAYRRLSGEVDQNHLLADAARAAGQHDRVEDYVAAMERAPRVPRDRVVEALIVLAGSRADAGDLVGGLRVLERAGLEPERVEHWHPRLWYAAADLAQRLGDEALAGEYAEAIRAVDDDFEDVRERFGGPGG